MGLYPSLFENDNSSKHELNNIIFSARVKDILLTNDSPLSKKTEGWSDLGSIQFKPLYKSIDINSDSNLIAKPLFSNIKQFPLKEEVVLIIKGPSNKLNNNPNSTDFYYFPLPVSIWNSNHHNAFPDIPNYNNKKEELDLGKKFVETQNIRNLLPTEGDILIEGRFGNSIRFSSTSKDTPWSNNGIKNSPITLIRNGQTLNTPQQPWIPIYEDINEDDSSIYLTSNQDIPLELSCKNLLTFNITLSNSFNSSLQILDTNSL